MPRVFLDANVLFSAGYNPSGGIGELWRLKTVELLTSRYAAAEAYRNMAEKYPDRLALLDRAICACSLVPEAPLQTLPAEIVLPEKDRPILQAAMAANADVLLSGDNHFRPYLGPAFGSLRIMRPRQFLLAMTSHR